MSIDTAVQLIVKESKKTGETSAILARRLWDKFFLSDSDIKALAQKSLADKASAFMTGKRPSFEEEHLAPYARPVEEIPPSTYSRPGHVEPRSPSITIYPEIKQEKRPDIILSLDVKVLHITSYDVGGKRKAFIQ